jgi:hypothetical protein
MTTSAAHQLPKKFFPPRFLLASRQGVSSCLCLTSVAHSLSVIVEGRFGADGGTTAPQKDAGAVADIGFKESASQTAFAEASPGFVVGNEPIDRLRETDLLSAPDAQDRIDFLEGAVGEIEHLRALLERQQTGAARTNAAVGAADVVAKRIAAARRHVRRGRECVKRQYEVIERLHAHRRPTDQAERVLEGLMEAQQVFETDYRMMLVDAQERLRAAGYADPTASWPRG